MRIQLLFVMLMCLLFNACVVQSPKYTTLNHVLNLKVGMTKEEVETELGIKPYDLQSRSDSGNVYIYVYRVEDRKTFSIQTREVNGQEVLGRYIQLAVTYTNDDKLVNMESCTLCPDNLEKVTKIDYMKIILFVTVTLPVILLFLGLK